MQHHATLGATFGLGNGRDISVAYVHAFEKTVNGVNSIPPAAGGGNADLTSDLTWLPLGATPAHPEYPAAHGCVTGAVAPLIASFFGTTRVNVHVDSKAFKDGDHQHTFADTRDLMDEVFWARIYAGFHFHHSLEVGRQLGETVAQELVRSHFRRHGSWEY